MSFERPAFCGYLAASGNGEVYDHSGANKFNQFGWRCTTNETGYKQDTLIGNWNEERYDTKNMAKSKPIPSQYNHYFGTTYKKSYTSATKIPELPVHVQRVAGAPSEPRTFPGHQPELDKESFKHHYNGFKTTSMAAFKHPNETLSST